MVPREIIKKILDESVQAPSGENAQPWRFGIKEDRIYVWNIPERDQSPYNFRQRASYFANGALIENISIAASVRGFDAEIALFPEKADPELVAIISLKGSTPKDEPLYASIALRATNRKPYKPQPLSGAEREQLIQIGKNYPGAEIFLTEKKDDIQALGMVGSMNERIVFENKFLHDFLFSHINWTEEENQKKKIGFDIKTLELPPPARAGFNIFKHWRMARFFNKFGLSKSIWKQNGKQYAAAAAVAIIAVPANTNEDFVCAGRVGERFWLTATKLGLSVQPMTGMLYFMQRILAGSPEPFSSSHVDLIKSSYETVCRIFGIHNKTIPMMFRIGHADPPSARSLKLPPEIIDVP